MSKILAIDDDYVVLELLKETLMLEGYDVICVSSGLDGLEQLIKEKPDLVLLDVMMPQFDGYEICKKIKECKSTADIPIIFVSAKAQPEDLEIAFSLGADDYVIKPFDMKDLTDRVKAAIKKYKNH